jgi:hypothetical protein
MAYASSMRYSPLTPIIRARSLTHECQSDSLSYSAGDVIRISVPNLPRSYIEAESSYLHVNFTNTSLAPTGNNAGTAISFDGSAYSLLQKVEVFSGTSASTLLESTDNVNVLMSMLMDMHMGGNERSGAFSVMAGTSASPGRDGRTISGNASQTLALPLPSFFGFFGTKSVPATGGYTIMLTLAPAQQALVGSAAGDRLGYTVNNVRFCASVIELGPAEDAALIKSYGGAPLSLPIIRWNSYTAQHPSGQLSNSLLIGCSASSVKSIIGTHRVPPSTDATVREITDRSRNNLDTLQVRAGTALIPPNRLRTESMFYASLLQSRHLMSYSGTEGLINSTNYWGNAGNSAGSVAFQFGVDLDCFTGRSDTLSSGVNLSGIQTFVDTTYSAAPAQAIVSLFCELNALLLVSPTGEATVAF